MVTFNKECSCQTFSVLQYRRPENASTVLTGADLITNESMGDRYKPAAHYLALCTQGRLLIILSSTL